MKKQMNFVILLVLVLTLTACGSNNKSQTAQGVISQEQSNILIAYFTVPETDGTDAVSSARAGL